MTARRTRLLWPLTGLLVGLAAWWPAPAAQAASIDLDQTATAIVGRTGEGVVVDPGSWAAAWWSAPARPACSPDAFQGPAVDTVSSFVQAETGQARLTIPLAANNQFVCFRAVTPAGDWLYSDWFAVRVQSAELSLDQRHQFVMVTASRPVTDDSWRAVLADDCPAAIDQPWPADAVRLSSDLQLVLELEAASDGQWLCVAATDRSWSTSVSGRHRLSRLGEVPPTVSIERSGNRLKASAEPAREGDDWHFFKSLKPPNCRLDPIPESGRVADPSPGDWLPGRESTVDQIGDGDEIWVCFIVQSSPDEFGNRIVGYGLYQVSNQPPPVLRGLVWLLALNVFIICAGAAIGILVYRTQPN